MMSVNIKCLVDYHTKSLVSKLRKFLYEIGEITTTKVVVVNIPTMKSLEILESVIRTAMPSGQSTHIDVFDEDGSHLFGSEIQYGVFPIRQTSLEQDFGLI